MSDSDEQQLLQQLEALERALLEPEKRIDREFLEAVLHPEFTEYGRSGRVYLREDIIKELQEVTDFPVVSASNFELKVLAKNVLLLTYLTAHLEENDQLSRCTLRSSIWVIGKNGPQLRFHQGTATN